MSFPYSSWSTGTITARSPRAAVALDQLASNERWSNIDARVLVATHERPPTGSEKLGHAPTSAYLTRVRNVGFQEAQSVREDSHRYPASDRQNVALPP